ncbi:hypothetical protein Tco_0959781 [Tanacetum coccineum]
MASGSNDRDALANLLQMGTMAEYQSVFENLINRVTGIPEFLLKSFYISGLKPAHFEEIVEQEQNIKEKADTTLPFPIEEALPVVKGPLDASEDTLLSLPVDEVRSQFSKFSKDKESVENVLGATKFLEGGNSYSVSFSYHLECKVNFEGVGNVTP